MFLTKILLGLCLINLAVSFGISKIQLDSAFETFKIDFGRKYANSVEEALRKEAFINDYLFIQDFNQRKAPLKLQLTDHSDWTEDEISNLFMATPEPSFEIESVHKDHYKNQSAPDSLDWRDSNMVTPVKNQGRCGSCWDFSALAALEARNLIGGFDLQTYSEQQIIDCYKKDCKGNKPEKAWNWIRENGGVALDKCYPYVSGTTKMAGICLTMPASCMGRSVSGFGKIDTLDEEDMKTEVANGPIVISICTSKIWGKWHKDNGIFYDDSENNCNNDDFCHGKVDGSNHWHAVTIVGYGTENDEDYWVIKNSWGTKYCDKGYIKMQRNSDYDKGQCYLAKSPVFPKL